MRMRKIKYVLAIALCLILVIAFCAKPLTIYIVKQALGKAFPESAVSIRSCSIKPFSLITFSDIEIKKEPAFAINLKQFEIRFRIISLLNANAFISIEGLDCELGKLRLSDCSARAVIKGRHTDLELLSCTIFGGQIKGNAGLESNGGPEYRAELNVNGIEIGELIEDFELGEKFRMSGMLSGVVQAEGKAELIRMLSGKLSAAPPGGTLVINDTRFLENIARSSGQSFEMLVESFRNYRYNTGMLKASLDSGNLVFDIALDGEAGRRKLDIVVHDFSLRSLIPERKPN